MKKLILSFFVLTSGCATTYSPQNINENSPFLRMHGDHKYNHAHGYSVLQSECDFDSEQQIGLVGGALLDPKEKIVQLKENKRLIILVKSYATYTSETHVTSYAFEFTPEANKRYDIVGIKLVNSESQLVPSDLKFLPINHCK
ncbi:hypothetical protein L4174_020515 [Photobacterium sp. CCB-ST2H9]|uniref:hypothetical protein n=1 Tax=Photobacterium sp. CCB-ST2H9 TaxID=2912855 RepID=UPI0020064BA4|nr:hypothetical protein [Photobacterium sp. CCB-ST2H9]UTM59099.1 hypothetical protein L4174_020515 [Photobacterium sp. CCB-ST2H9]